MSEFRGPTGPLFFIDFETRARVSLPDVGAHRYVEDPDFRPLLLSIARGDEPVRVLEFRTNLSEIEGQTVCGWGSFDRVVLDRLGVRYARYVDAMVWSAEYGWPLKLEMAAEAAGLPMGKDPRGKRLINLFCAPNRKGEWVEPGDRLEDWQHFKEYCSRDLVVMRDIVRLLPPVGEEERELLELDWRVNKRGIRVDRAGVETLSRLRMAALQRADETLRRVTQGSVSGASQVARLCAWTGLPDMRKDTVEAALQDVLLSDDKKAVLLARQEGSKSSGSKLTALRDWTCGDDRLRGMIQACGAATRRWAGRGPQPQNFPRDSFDADQVKHLLLLAPQGVEAVEREFEMPAATAISKALRGMLLPDPGHLLIAVDYSSIEARVLAWLAGQEDALAVYRARGDVYVAMASAVYGIAESEVTKGQRFIGKTLVLGCGYMLGWAKLQATLAGQGITVDEQTARSYINAFRERYDRVARLWSLLAEAATKAIQNPGTTYAYYADKRTGKPLIMFRFADDVLRMRLPNSMVLYYHGAKVEQVPAPWDPEQRVQGITAMARTKAGWRRRTLSPGLLTENAVQSIAREILKDAMLRLDRDGAPVLLTVHDEIILQARAGRAERALARTEALMRVVPAWAEGLPLEVEGKVMERYGK